MKAASLSRCGQIGAPLLVFFFVVLRRVAPAVALSSNKFDELVDLRLRRVQEACGQLCNMSAANLVPGSPFGHVQQHIQCKAIWNESGIDAQRETKTTLLRPFLKLGSMSLPWVADTPWQTQPFAVRLIILVAIRRESSTVVIWATMRTRRFGGKPGWIQS
jgi:hypothetical protein